MSYFLSHTNLMLLDWLILSCNSSCLLGWEMKGELEVSLQTGSHWAGDQLPSCWSSRSL